MFVDDENSLIKSGVFDPDDDMVSMDIVVANEDTANRIRAKEPTGVSIEANITSCNDANEIIAFTGTGVSIIFYPDQPACPISDGCGILSSDPSNSENHINTDDPSKDPSAILTATPSRVKTNLSGGINITGNDQTEVTPDSPLSSTTDGVVSQEDFQKISAKLLDTRKELAELKSTNVTQKYEDQISAKDAQLATLQAEIDSRDSTIAESIVAQIVELDPEFKADGKSLSDLEMIHASLSRVAEKIQSEVKTEPEPDPYQTTANFRAPSDPDKKDALSIGGIVAGKWIGGNGNKPTSSVVSMASGDQ